VNSTPSLPSHNHFEVLSVESLDEESISMTPPRQNLLRPVEDVSTPSSPPVPSRIKIKPWERKLPRKYVVASTPSLHSLELKVEMQTTDTGQLLGAAALLDSGATGLFIDSHLVQQKRLTTRPLSRPIPVYNVDGSPNEAGAVREVVDLVLRYKDHSERTLFAVTQLGKQQVILGYPWLRDHNPEIDWATGEVTMSRCPSLCRTCFTELKKERRTHKATTERMRRCRAGPMPTSDVELEDVPDLVPDSDDDEEETEEVEEGDRIFYTAINQRSEVRATSNISQRLAEAFHKNSTPKSFSDSVPSHLHDFEDVFSKESFDSLPSQKPWDHVIELIPGATPSSCKVYPLSPDEQKQLDKFLDEHLTSGRIRPSKSPMASPFFFIKKKDGSLRPVQDY
jgi:hypothetical protein